jgi:biotin carboxyl carrier protein
MEGKILRIIGQVGERVEEDEPLLVLDAMKMEIEVVAPVTGTIHEIHVSEGQSIDSDTTLVTID